MVLVTGHKGMIGSRLMDKLGDLAIGIDIKDGLDLLTCPLPQSFNLEYIYHLAAQTSVESSWQDPLHDADNLKMVIRLVKRYPDVKIIYANSAAAIEPISSPYGFSKWACAEYIKRFHNNYVICTFPNVYGGAVKSVVDIFKNKDEVTIYGDGLQVRDFVHVDDIVQGLLAAPQWPKGEYQMGSGVGTNILSLAKGKKVIHSKPRKEVRESILRNDTPNWSPKINVYDYLNS